MCDLARPAESIVTKSVTLGEQFCKVSRLARLWNPELHTAPLSTPKAADRVHQDGAEILASKLVSNQLMHEAEGHCPRLFALKASFPRGCGDARRDARLSVPQRLLSGVRKQP